MTSNTKTALLVSTIVLLFFMAIFLTNKETQASEQPMITDFVCEMSGNVSNRHFNIRYATYQGRGDWFLVYADSGNQTTYLQRHGEDCHTESYPTNG